MPKGKKPHSKKPPQHEHPFPGNMLQTVPNFYNSYEEINGRDEFRYFVDDVDQADVVTSVVRDPEIRWPNDQRAGANSRHRPVIDIDFPVKLIPSSTEGHFHLYIDREMSWFAYVNLLNALADVGVVERGYVDAALRRGFTAVRLPWIDKGDSTPPDSTMPTCFRCGKPASAFRTYLEQATDEEVPVGFWVRHNEGTYNPLTNHFACDKCYIEIGQPSSPTGWKAP